MTAVGRARPDLPSQPPAPARCRRPRSSAGRGRPDVVERPRAHVGVRVAGPDRAGDAAPRRPARSSERSRRRPGARAPSGCSTGCRPCSARTTTTRGFVAHHDVVARGASALRRVAGAGVAASSCRPSSRPSSSSASPARRRSRHTGCWCAATEPRAPGMGADLRLVVPPEPRTWALIPSWEWLRAGVDGARSRPAVTVATRAGRLEERVGMPSLEARRRIESLPGVGRWSSAEVAQRALGDPDAVSFGDYHVAKNIGWALTGDAGRRRRARRAARAVCRAPLPRAAPPRAGRGDAAAARPDGSRCPRTCRAAADATPSPRCRVDPRGERRRPAGEASSRGAERLLLDEGVHTLAAASRGTDLLAALDQLRDVGHGGSDPQGPGRRVAVAPSVSGEWSSRCSSSSTERHRDPDRAETVADLGLRRSARTS